MTDHAQPGHIDQPTTGTASESTLTRIRGLLAQAENTPYPDEAETFRDKAFALIARHSVDETLLGNSGAADEMGETWIDMDGAYGDSRATLLGGIARAMHCYTLNWQRKRARAPHQCSIYGRRSDREKVELLYTSLLLQATRQVANVQPEHLIGATAGDVRNARRSWFAGFAHAVEERLTSRVEEAAAGTGTELVLADRATAAEHYARQLHNPGKARPRNHRDTAALRDGVEAGRRADIGVDRLGGAARQLTH